ncbi:MAG: cobaltochelatase subunit CobN, partial [Cucumibacter sp.]
MHLLAAQAGAIQQEGEAIDLDQSPAPILILSAADSELTMLAGAADRAGAKDLRLASTLRLAHHLSVDRWIDKTARHARLVVARLLGGRAYWPYGVDELVALAASTWIKLALLPGDATPDPDLLARSTVSEAVWRRLHGLFTAGGPENADLILAACRALADNRTIPDAPPRPFPRFGHWWPGEGIVEAEQIAPRIGARAVTPILFYRAALEGAGTATLEALVAALEETQRAPVPLLVSSLKEASCVRFVRAAFERFPPAAILNLTGFALGLDSIEEKLNPFAGTDAPIIQLIQSGRPAELWRGGKEGLSAKDLAMQLVLPEIDGRIGGLIVGHKEADVWHKATECPLSAYAPDAGGIAAAVELAGSWIRLRHAAPADRRIGIVLANYPIRDGRLANGVGYDAPQSTIEILKLLADAGYALDAIPATGNDLIDLLQSGPTNANPQRGEGELLSFARYRELFAALPEELRNQVTTRWGAPEKDRFARADGFHLPVIAFGNVAILLQPSRGYDLDPEAAYHSPDLVPPHGYVAAYLWLAREFSAHAIVHNGKHGNLEWLPGRATALGPADYPMALWGRLPHLYPFIVNDPGEGTQAKRRAGAVIIDHLIPPLTRAETYGPLKDLEALCDEYFAASGMDRRRLQSLRRRIFDLSRDTGLDEDAGIAGEDDLALGRLDTYLCELKESQIRDGLHVFGQCPTGALERDLVVALTRVPRGETPGEASLIRALADDLALGFDPLTAGFGAHWRGPKPEVLARLSGASWRTSGDTVERLELLAAQIVDGAGIDPNWAATHSVLSAVKTRIRPVLAACGSLERENLLKGLDGKFVPPGPSGAPSRGRLDVLPTGRNFHSLDNRAVPTPTAWELGRKSAESLLARHFQDHGVPLRSAALSVWGTSNMRTGGDDIAQALALIGAKPVWDPGSLRVSGYEIIPLAKLGRPRTDVTLKISGLFRDAFPGQIELFDRAARAIGALDEPEDQNPIAARMRSDALMLIGEGANVDAAALKAGYRIFGSKPGAYGAGLQGLIDSGNWKTNADLATAFLNWGQYAYGAKSPGTPERARFAARLKDIDAVLHNQDNREHDVLDSDDYYQFEGGLAATATVLSG